MLLLAFHLDTLAAGFGGARFLALKGDTAFVLTEDGFVLRLGPKTDTVLGPLEPPPGGLAFLGESLLVLSGGKLWLWDTLFLTGLPVHGAGLLAKRGEVFAGFGGQGFLGGCVLKLLPNLRVVKCPGDLLGMGAYWGELVLLTSRGVLWRDTLFPLPPDANPSSALEFHGRLLVLCPGSPSVPPGQPPAGVWVFPEGIRLPLALSPWDGEARGDTLLLLEDGALVRLILPRKKFRRILRKLKK